MKYILLFDALRASVFISVFLDERSGIVDVRLEINASPRSRCDLNLNIVEQHSNT